MAANEIRSQSPEIDQARAEAMAWADRLEVSDPDAISERIELILHRRMSEEIKFFMRIKEGVLRIASDCVLPRYLVYADGRVEVIRQPLATPTQKLLDQIDELIDGVRRRYFPGNPG